MASRRRAERPGTLQAPPRGRGQYAVPSSSLHVGAAQTRDVHEEFSRRAPAGRLDRRPERVVCCVCVVSQLLKGVSPWRPRRSPPRKPLRRSPRRKPPRRSNGDSFSGHQQEQAFCALEDAPASPTTTSVRNATRGIYRRGSAKRYSTKRIADRPLPSSRSAAGPRKRRRVRREAAGLYRDRASRAGKCGGIGVEVPEESAASPCAGKGWTADIRSGVCVPG